MSSILRFIRSDDATTSVEYAVLLALILMAVIASVRALGTTSGGMWGSNKTKLDAVGF
ncbi:Flp/Fap pilin component [Maioricimonas rarisocia]|uniref:Flp/Fap pilin component n=1 Tax=Maioricimonas rarisocia TaxID=2528026 RepID=A0A517Z574_9PLAN|nr:Flp family type IVb pilin [Maioricimonas rarisocia]QDU37626.1 Flp/Fap pilin component [Maioricimonas rarisocia]